MFRLYNIEQIEKLKSENEEFSEAFESLSSDYNMTLRKIAHEFGNALTLINSSLQIIESSHPEVHSFNYWDSTMDDVGYLKHLIAEISLLNNSEHLNLSPVNLMSIVKNAVNSFSSMPIVTDNNITINFTASDNIPDIMGDYIKLKQVVINILKNAIEASQPNGVVEVSMLINNDRLFTIIKDNGCGMTSEQLDTIFLPMITYKTGGTGLGLPISRKIINAHHGTINVISSPDKGSSFTISLPI